MHTVELENATVVQGGPNHLLALLAAKQDRIDIARILHDSEHQPCPSLRLSAGVPSREPDFCSNSCSNPGAFPGIHSHTRWPVNARREFNWHGVALTGRPEDRFPPSASPSTPIS
jgi:hypothetical protein